MTPPTFRLRPLRDDLIQAPGEHAKSNPLLPRYSALSRVLVPTPAAVIPMNRATGTWAIMAAPCPVVVGGFVRVHGPVVGVQSCDAGGDDVRLVPTRFTAPLLLLLPLAAVICAVASGRRERGLFAWRPRERARLVAVYYLVDGRCEWLPCSAGWWWCVNIKRLTPKHIPHLWRRSYELRRHVFFFAKKKPLRSR